MRNTLNWGIIAPGRVAHRFAQDLSLTDGARLYAVASRSQERAKTFADMYGAAHAYGSYEEILSCPDLDIVYIASPHSGHYEHTRMCLTKGIPVLCEKPLAMNLAQARDMVATARSSGTFLMEAIWTRFIPLFEETLQLLQEGILGEIMTVRADFGFRALSPATHRVFNKALGGGSLLEAGVYPVFLALLLLGKPERIQAAAVLGETGVDESCAVLLECPGGKLAILDSSAVTKTGTEAFIYGEKGTVHLYDRLQRPTQRSIHFYEKASEHRTLQQTGSGYCHEIMEVGDLLRAGKLESDKLPLDFSLLLMETLDAIRKEAGIRYEDVD